MKIHGKSQVYFYKSKIYLKKSDAPKDAIKITKEADNG